MSKINWSLIFIFTLLLSFSCQFGSQSTENRSYDHSLEVMSYNVENLFDTSHDVVEGEEKQDYMFLPHASKIKRKGCAGIRSNYWQRRCFETDWTQDKLKIKIDQLKRMITRDGKKTPDFLAVSEIENDNVAQMLADALGFGDYIITKGLDSRGIELALFYNPADKLKMVSHQEHRAEGLKTRSILEVEFLIDENKKLVFLLNHWPSQGSPVSTRIKMAELMSSRVNTLQKENSKVSIIALGDFNVIDSDKPHPFKEVLYKKTNLKDLHSGFINSKKISKNQKQLMPLGTYFYAPKMTWNLLDRIFVNSDLLEQGEVHIDLASYHIYAPEFAKTKKVYKDRKKSHFGSVVQGVPLASNFNAKTAEKAGFSDHFPLVFNLSY